MTPALLRAAGLVSISVCWIACGRSHVAAPYPLTQDASAMDAHLDANMDASSSMDASGAMDGACSDIDAHAEEGDASTGRSRVAQNIILFLGDGMGPEQLATGRFGASGPLRLDALRGPSLANTDSLTSDVNQTPTDSAAAASAIATGVRVRDWVISQAPDGTPLDTILECLKRRGKATGVVTTSYFYDASPAAFTAHAANRGHTESIAHQILTVTQPDVVMGAPGTAVSEATALNDATAAGYFVVRDMNALDAWDPVAEPRLFGLFSTTFALPGAGELFTMTPSIERDEHTTDPTLAQMTRRALERLSQDPDGFFLFAEDEIFDQLGHNGRLDTAWANRAYPLQARALDAAVGVAIDWVLEYSSFEETLIVVLADHETGGYRFDHAIGPSSGTFMHGGHTRTPIEVYALGPGSEGLPHLTQHTDSYRMMLGLLP